MISLDIYSDPICPWCYIGKSQLDAALEGYVPEIFDIAWHPFQLNPEMPLDGMDRRDYLARKFGGQQQAVQAYLPVVEHAQKAGLTLHLEKIERTPNTLSAHRLIHWAGLEGLQSDVAHALFSAYFVNGRNIGDSSVLLDIAANCGMDAAMVERLLETDADITTIQDADQHAREMGMSGVPCFIVAGHHVVPGAQSKELWQNVIADILQTRDFQMQ